MVQLQKHVEGLTKLGFKVLAISPDKPEILKQTAEKYKLTLTLLADNKMDSARYLGIAFRLSERLRNLYTNYGIDLQKASGEDHYQLPVPAAIISEPGGKIQFIHVDPDYRKRLSTDMIIAAAKSIKENSEKFNK